MAMSKLSYILPTETKDEHVGDVKQAKGEMKSQSQSRSRSRSRTRSCHDQLVSMVRRSVRSLVNAGSELCSSNKSAARQELAAFHDIGGVEFSENHANPNPNPKIFSFAELYIGTNGFSHDQVLGSGGFGRVFKAVLPSDDTFVAVKCLLNTTSTINKRSFADDRVKNNNNNNIINNNNNNNNKNNNDNDSSIDKSFAAELVAVAHLRHRNLVRLRGWCVHENQLFLVYDYMPNRSLDRVLFKNSSNSLLLDFEKRSNIVLGLAAALFYLHEQLETQIIHRDVKTSNVMLDSHYNARLGDFGLARWLEHDNHHPLTATTNNTRESSSRRSSDYQFRLAETSRIGGTIGYLPPESFQKRYIATSKSDVFSFGIVALEVAAGRRAIDLTYTDDKIILLDWVRRLADDGSLLLAADTRLSDGSYKLDDMERLIHLGLLCTLHNPKSRPHMKWVLDALCGNLSGKLPPLPCFKTHPLYISLSSGGSSDSSGEKWNPTANSTTTTTTTTTTATASPSPISTIYITAAGRTLFVTAEGVGDTKEEDTDTDADSKRSLPVRTSFSLPVVETPREISYKEIVSATNNFSDNCRVAELDFGTAYQGFLDNRHHVLVKRLGMKTCPALRARFSTELQNLGRLRHRNLVQLRGWCMEQGEMLVVYDYLASRLLSNMLFHNSRNKVLQWHQRYNIIRSLASAIVYLHEEWDEQVIHRNITSSSIVVDPDMNPRLSSFALAEFLTRNEHGHHVASSDNSVRGIFGYMSPEYMESGEANTAADVYSFGVVVLEVVTGQMAVDFRHPEVLLVRRIREFEATDRPLEDLADPQLDREYKHQEFVRLLKLGLACTNSCPSLRPDMRQIASILNGNSSCFVKGCKERIEEWKLANAYSLSLIKRIQALGIQ